MRCDGGSVHRTVANRPSGDPSGVSPKPEIFRKEGLVEREAGQILLIRLSSVELARCDSEYKYAGVWYHPQQKYGVRT